MVRKIKVVDVYSKPEANEEATPEPTPSDEAQHNDASENKESTVEPMTEASESEHETEPPPPPPEPETESDERGPSPQPRKTKPMLNMPTTPKVLQQVQCQACLRKMSAKVLRYSHAKYCTEREREEQPEAIPIPKLSFKNSEQLKEQTSLPVKNQKPKPKLQRTKSYTEPKPQTPPTPPPHTPQIQETFQNRMRQVMQQKEAKYQTMMSNAFWAQNKHKRG